MSALWDFPLSNDPPVQSSTIPYRVHCPHLTQVTGKKLHYFKLRLYDIQRFFPTKISWNQDYSPAQQIYSDSPMSAALRAAISTQHSIIYSGRRGRCVSVEGQLDRNPKGFFDLLNEYQDQSSILSLSPIHSTLKAGYDLLSKSMSCSIKTDVKKDKVPIYTYVLMENSLRFSRTGAAMLIDMSSKHALHAAAFPEVCFAGEFWMEPPAAPGVGEQTLYMDNNSGTFAPPRKDLHRMAWLMEANFPGIKVVVLDYQDPEWNERRKKE